MTDSLDPPASTKELNAVEHAIRSRKTSKIIMPVATRGEQEANWSNEHDAVLRRLIASAGWAPFHKRVHASHCEGDLSAPMPWRFHVVGSSACTGLLSFLEAQAQQHPDSKWGRAWQSKIKEMLAACGVLVQVTWLPEPIEDMALHSASTTAEFTDKNIEHIAAASSATQNLLLASESHGWCSYWSSGGILRDHDLFDYLGIGTREKLLGSIFLTPSAHPSARVIDGGLREQRGDLSGWVRWL